MASTFALGLLVVAALLHLGLWGTLLLNLAYLRRMPAPDPASPPSLSVCIPARNEAENLRRLLPTLLEQDYPSFEVIVCDDGSEDETWAVLQSFDTPVLRAVAGEGPPEGWIGKVHALYQCTRRASGDRYLFLDADAELTGPDALRQLVGKHETADSGVTTGLPRLRGAAALLVSLVPYSLLTGLPWPLVPRTRLPALSALNGQCWLIDAALYHRHEPHERLRNAVLEDVAIGRYLKRQGHPPILRNVQSHVSVYMYDGFWAAWAGFRKNAYLLLGGAPIPFVGMYGYFLFTWVVAPILSPWFLVSLYGLKWTTDRANGFASTTTLWAPLSFVLGLVLQLDSAVHHWTDRVTWKGRSVPSSRPPEERRPSTSPENSA